MKPLSYFAVTSQQVASHLVEMMKLEATLNAGATAVLYLQIHDVNVVPADGVIPLRCWPATECAYKEFKRGDLTLAQGCYICLSSTAATKTLATGGSDKCDILEVELIQAEEPSGTTFVGSIASNATPIQSLQVWAEANAPHVILSLAIYNQYQQPFFVLIFAKDNPVNGDIPLEALVPKNGTAVGVINKFTFGVNGFSPVRIDVQGIHAGCTVCLSTTPGFLTTLINGYSILAEFK